MSTFPPIISTEPSQFVKRLFLCRHGETKANATGVLQGSGIDLELNERGIKQAEFLRDQLTNENIDVIVCSKLKRAIQTAKIVSERHPHAEFIEIEEFAEISWGDWEGSQSPMLSKLLTSWQEGDYYAKSPNGESPTEVESRAVPALYDIILKRPEKSFAFVVHGRLLRILLSSILFHSLENMNHFTHHNTCINLIDVIVETDPEKYSKTAFCEDRFHALKDVNVNLDDNVNLNMTNNLKPKKHAVPSIALSKLEHPTNIKFVPILLDDRRHLPAEHGETHANASRILQGSGIDMDLNGNGKLQARALQEELKNKPLEMIVCSKLKRARQTAEIVGKCHPTATFMEIQELEESSFGDWEGTKSPLLNELLTKWGNGQFEEKPPNGESPIDVQNRVMPVIYDIILNREESVILFVVHGAMLRIILSSLLFRSLDNTHLFSNHNACINVLQIHVQDGSVDKPLQDDRLVLKQFANGAPIHTVRSTGTHPENLVMIPILLDYTGHLKYTRKW